MILFLRIEEIEDKEEKRLEKYSVRLNAKTESSDAIGREAEENKEPIEIHINGNFKRTLYDFAEFHRKPASIQNIKIGENINEQLEWEEKLGIDIYKTFFPGSIGETFEKCLNLLVQKKIDRLNLIIASPVPWILDIPFEMMRKEKGSTPFSLCHEHFHLIHSIETGLAGFHEKVLEAEAPPLKILFVSALPVELPDENRLIELEKEQELLIGAVGELISKQKVVVEFLDIATLEEIEKSLKEGQHQVVHFSGHGSHPKASVRDEGVLYLEDEWGRIKKVTGQEIAQVLKKFPCIRLVVLSACETARAGESGVAGALLKAGIPAVLGMRYPVKDKAASLFTTCFYEDICAGKSLDRAMYYARQAVYDLDQEKIDTRKKKKNDTLLAIQWVNPFLYQQRTIRQLLDPTKKSTDIHHFLHKPQSPLAAGGKYIGRGFIGRHKEILYLHRLIRDGNRCVCIYGQGGTGKTTLAVRFAHHFEKGAYKTILFIGQVTEESILSRLAEEAAPSLGEGIKNFVQSPDYEPINKLNLLIEDYLSKEKVFLLFDNFEENQVAAQSAEREAHSEKVYQPEIHSESLKTFLVHLCQNLSESSYIFFTTRYRFPEPEIVSLNLGEMRFCDTFKLINRFWKLVQLSLGEKRQIHQKLGGHPRALELLESYIKSKKVTWKVVNKKLKKVEKWEINHDLLMDMLWHQLSEDEKLSLMGASIFRGLTTFEGLIAVTNQDEKTAKQTLQSLNSLSLLYLENNKLYTHRLTATFIKTTKMNKTQIKNSHVKAAEYFWGGVQDEKVKKALTDSLKARWHFMHAEEWDKAAELTCGIQEYLTIWGYPRLSFELLKEISGKDISEKNNAMVCNSFGALYFDFGNYDKALKLYKKAMKIFRKEKEIKGLSIIFYEIGMTYQAKGYYDQALKYHKKSLEIKEKTGDVRGISNSLGQIGEIYQNKGEYDQALKNYKKSLKIREKNGAIREVSYSLHQIGIIYKDKGDYERALKNYEKSLEIRKKIGDIKGVSLSLSLIGNIYSLKGDYNQAQKKYKKALEISEKIGDIRMISDILRNIGTLNRDMGKHEQALKHHKKSLEMRERIGDIKGISDSLHQIGIIYQDKGDYSGALDQYEISLKIKEKVGDIRGKADILNHIGVIYQNKSNYDKALEHYEKSFEIYEKIGDIYGIASNFVNKGKLYFEIKDYINALEFSIKAFSIFSKLGSPHVNLAKRVILNVKGRIPEKQFDEILEKFDLPIEVFNTPKESEKKGEYLLKVLNGITNASVSIRERSSEEKENLKGLLKDMIDELPYTSEIEGIKFYFQMLLSYITDGDYKKYIEKIPEELMEMFEKVHKGSEFASK